MSFVETAAGIKNDLVEALDSYPHAIYKLLVNGIDIGTTVQDRLISMTITDNRGLEADSIEIELSDHDGLLEIPPKEAEIEAWIGWSNSGLVYKGKYLVKERSYSGAPDTLSIRATSADLKTTLKQKKERSFDDVTLQDMVQTIATAHDLELKIDAELAQHKVVHLAQNESDANLLTRLADEHDAIATIKNGKLLFMPLGKGTTVSGYEFPTFYITRDKGDNHNWSDVTGGDDVSAVQAFYYDATLAKKLEVKYGDDSNQNIKTIRHVYQDKQSATLVAKAKLNKLRRSAYSFSYSLAYGESELIPEMTFIFAGLKAEIDEIYWLGTKVVHKFSVDGGYTTDLELEVFCPDSDDVSELFEDQFELEKNKKWTGVTVYYQNGDKAEKLTKGDASNSKHFTYLYKTKEGAQARLDREYALLDLETGKFSEHNELEIKPYTGIKTFYTSKGSGRQVLTVGDQSNAKVLDRVYKTKLAAQKALDREFPRLNAKKDMLQQVKVVN